jgi:hypothetical protein
MVTAVSQNAEADPPDKKRSPGSGATEHGAKRRNSRSVSRKHITKQPQQAQESDRSLSVYDGRDRLASITGQRGDFVVVMADGALLGSFNTLGRAIAAISTAQGGVR